MEEARRKEEMFLFVFRGPISDALKDDPLVCRHWKYPSGNNLYNNQKISTYDCCQKEVQRDDAVFHSKKCKNQYCMKILAYDPVESSDFYFNTLNIRCRDFSIYCKDCYYNHYKTLGTYDLDKFNVHTSILQNIISRITKIPGSRTKSANKI